MKLIDIILIIAIIIVVLIIFYFSYWRHRKEPCHGCPYAKTCRNNDNCDKKQKLDK